MVKPLPNQRSLKRTDFTWVDYMKTNGKAFEVCLKHGSGLPSPSPLKGNDPFKWEMLASSMKSSTRLWYYELALSHKMGHVNANVEAPQSQWPGQDGPCRSHILWAGVNHSWWNLTKSKVKTILGRATSILKGLGESLLLSKWSGEDKRVTTPSSLGQGVRTSWRDSKHEC